MTHHESHDETHDDEGDYRYHAYTITPLPGTLVLVQVQAGTTTRYH
jgi:hypothetical protein